MPTLKNPLSSPKDQIQNTIGFMTLGLSDRINPLRFVPMVPNSSTVALTDHFHEGSPTTLDKESVLLIFIFLFHCTRVTYRMNKKLLNVS